VQAKRRSRDRLGERGRPIAIGRKRGIGVAFGSVDRSIGAGVHHDPRAGGDHPVARLGNRPPFDKFTVKPAAHKPHRSSCAT
jgi:hypothetical protein